MDCSRGPGFATEVCRCLGAAVGISFVPGHQLVLVVLDHLGDRAVAPPRGVHLRVVADRVKLPIQLVEEDEHSKLVGLAGREAVGNRMHRSYSLCLRITLLLASTPDVGDLAEPVAEKYGCRAVGRHL
jgi:hypothetical protein